MTYTCYQGNDHDCGFAALKMLLANVSGYKSYLYMNKPQKKKNYTYYDLIQYARWYGFRLSAYRLKQNEYMLIPKHSLVLLKHNHLVYIKKVHRKYVIIFDPYYGKERMSIKDFQEFWDGTLLTCIDKKHARKLDFKKNRLVPVWMDVVHYLLIGIIFASLLVGFYLIKDDSSIIVTMVFLLLFGIAELVENWYIIKELNFFDKTFLPKFFSRKKNCTYRQYSFYMEFKTKYFATSKTLVSNLIMIGAFSTLLFLNDYRNIFSFLILLLIKVADNKFFSKGEQNDIRQIENIESVAFDVDKMVVRNLSAANKLAGRVSLFASIKKVFYLFTCLCLALGMMLFTSLTSTNFVIFHFGIYFMSSEAFEHIINYFSNSTKRRQKEAQFFDACDL